MTYPSVIIINDTNSTEASQIYTAISSIYNDIMKSCFLYPLNYSENIIVTFRGIHKDNNPYTVPSNDNYYASSQFGIIINREQIILGNVFDSHGIISTNVSDVEYLVNRLYIEVGPDFNYKYDAFNGSDYSFDLGTTLFHEISHALTLTSSGNPISILNPYASDRFLAEQIAVFATNSVYTKGTSAPERVGHTGGQSSGQLTGSSAPQTSYISTSDSMAFAWNDNNATFRTEDGRAGQAHSPDAAFTIRTYYREPIIDGVTVRNYITVERDTGSAGAPVFGSSAGAMDAKAAALVGQSYIAGGASSIYQAYSAAAAAVLAFSGNTNFSLARTTQSRTVMVSNERFSDGNSSMSFDDTGPVKASNGTSLDKFYLIDTGTAKDTFLVGGGTTTPDMIKSGFGNDVIAIGAYNGSLFNEAWGGRGSDILIGRGGNDYLNGGDDNDILIASGGNDQLVGGGGYDAVYYGKLTAGISYGSDGVTKYNGTDTLTDIRLIVGTTYSDSFFAQGQGMIFNGNGGYDRFYAADGADTFIKPDAGNQSGSLDFKAMTTGVTITTNSVKLGGTTDKGHIWNGIANISGTTHDDIIDARSATPTYGGMDSYIHGSDGNDTFHAGADIRALYGDGGTDHFYIYVLGDGQTMDGGTSNGDSDILDFSKYTGTGTIELRLQDKLYSGSYGVDNHYAGIENFVFGNTSMYITGTTGTDFIDTGTGKSIINGAGGIDYIMVIAADPGTAIDPLSFQKVTIYGGSEIGQGDFIVAYRGSTIKGEGGNDTIYGSDEYDEIHGGTGNDMIYAGGGNEIFGAGDLQGVDHIDAGNGVDGFYGNKISDYDFLLSADMLEIGVQRTGSANSGDVMFFKNLENFDFYQSYLTTGHFTAADATAALVADADHYMTGAELTTALTNMGHPPIHAARAIISEDGTSIQDEYPAMDSLNKYDMLSPVDASLFDTPIYQEDGYPASAYAPEYNFAMTMVSIQPPLHMDLFLI